MSRVTESVLTRRVRLAEVLLVVIVVVGAILVTNAIVGVGGPFGSTYSITLRLAQAGGLHDHSDVTYRGQYIGTVSDVRLVEGGVLATLDIAKSVRLPVDTQVVVADLSAVGEQYVDFRPRVNTGPYLQDGSVISAGIGLPMPQWQVFADVQRMFRHIAPHDIAAISRQMTAIFGPGDVDLGALTNEVIGSVRLASHLSRQMFTIIDGAQAPLTTLAELSPDLRTFAANANVLARSLRTADPAIAALLDNGAVVIPIVSRLVTRLTPIVVHLLADGTPVAVMAAHHLPGLEHWYAFTPSQLTAMAQSTRDGSGWVVLVATPGRNCLYGPTVTPYQRSTALPLSARCTTVDPAMQQRGAQYVPHQ